MWPEPAADHAAPLAAALRDAALDRPGHLKNPDGHAAAARFDVYRNNVTHGLTEALGAIFPAVKAQCGQARFADLARLYVQAHPPRSRLVFEYGGDFADFIDGFAPARQALPWLADLARLERAWLDAYHAADAKPLDAGDLAALTPDALMEARFVVHPAMRLVAARYAIHDLFEAGRAGTALSAPLEAQACLVTRPALSVEVRLLPPGGHAFFAALADGDTLGAAAQTALEAEPTFDLGAGLGALLSSGFAHTLA